ncbi:MAG: hypothetical protein JST91_13075 [Actinobacteria bacterium]|nr:hypothetical protein [Actinomycetota bacterium]
MAIGRRPAVVLSRDAAIPRFRRALVAPCTTTIRGRLSDHRMRAVCAALNVAVACNFGGAI